MTTTSVGTKTDLESQAGHLPPGLDSEPADVAVDEDFDDDGFDDDGEPDPPAWEDATITVGPADETLHRTVTIEIVDVSRSERLFVDRRHEGRVSRFIADAGAAAGIPNTYNRLRVPQVPTWLLATVQHRAKVADKGVEQFGQSRTMVFRDIADMAEKQQQTEMLVEELLHPHLLGVIIGSPKVGKTMLGGVDLAVGLASGTSVWGRHLVPRRRRVLFISGETAIPRVVECCGLSAASKGTTLNALRGFLTLSSDVPCLQNAEDLSALWQQIENMRAEVVIIDPITVALPGLNLATFELARVLYVLSQQCVERGVTLLLVCHATKATKSGAPRLSDVAYGFDRVARQWFCIGRRGPYVAGSGLHSLEILHGSSMGDSGLLHLDFDERAWSFATSDVPAGVATNRTPTADADCQRVLALLRASPAGETKRSLKVAGGFRSDRLERALSDLLAGGEIEFCEIQKPNRKAPYDGFRATENKLAGNGELSGERPIVPDAPEERGTGNGAVLHTAPVPRWSRSMAATGNGGTDSLR